MTDFIPFKERIYKAKIHINCGFCALQKGCVIKKQFRTLAETFDKQGFIPVFEMKCPYIEPEYKDGDNVLFTVGYGVHFIDFKWK